MFGKSKKTNSKIEKIANNHLNSDEMALSYQASIEYIAHQKVVVSNYVAFISLIIALISVLAVVFLTPLKSVEPYVIRVDNTTGMVDIITSINEETLSDREALDKYFTSYYVKIREGYHFDMLNQDYTLTQLMSSPNVTSEYLSIYESDPKTNKKARNEILGNKFNVDVDIVSVTLEKYVVDENEQATEKSIARIRFNLIQTAKNDNNTEVSKSSKIATISYGYDIKSLKTEEERLKNPLGFKVMAYRIDDEIVR